MYLNMVFKNFAISYPVFSLLSVSLTFIDYKHLPRVFWEYLFFSTVEERLKVFLERTQTLFCSFP